MTQSRWQLWRDRRGHVSWLRIATLAVLLLPLAKAVLQANEIAHGARPLNELIHRAGFWALVFLGVTLAVTPFRRILRYGNLIDVRRMLGVGTFCYIAAHLALFFADQSYSLGKVVHEITPPRLPDRGCGGLARPCRAGGDLDRWHGAPARRNRAGGACTRSSTSSRCLRSSIISSKRRPT